MTCVTVKPRRIHLGMSLETAIAEFVGGIAVSD